MSFPLFENDEQEGFKVTPLMIQKTKKSKNTNRGYNIMSVLDEVLTACQEYKKNGDEPRFIIMPANRTRELLTDLIELQGEGCPKEIVEVAHIKDDDDLADAMTKLSLHGVHIMVVTTQIVIGGWDGHA